MMFSVKMLLMWMDSDDVLLCEDVVDVDAEVEVDVEPSHQQGLLWVQVSKGGSFEACDQYPPDQPLRWAGNGSRFQHAFKAQQQKCSAKRCSPGEGFSVLSIWKSYKLLCLVSHTVEGVCCDSLAALPVWQFRDLVRWICGPDPGTGILEEVARLRRHPHLMCVVCGVCSPLTGQQSWGWHGGRELGWWCPSVCRVCVGVSVSVSVSVYMWSLIEESVRM